MPPASLSELFAVLREVMASTWPGRTPKRLVIDTMEGDRLVLPVPVPVAAPAGRTVQKAEEEAFVPTAFQEAILGALEGRALRTDALGLAVGDRSRLFKPHGLKELREQGLVSWHSRLGFYRPDAPPEELEGQDQS